MTPSEHGTKSKSFFPRARAGLATLALIAGAAGASPAQAQIAIFHDATDSVEVGVFPGPWVSGQHNIATSTVPAGWVVVGGGGEIAGSEAPGALLTGAEPTPDLRSFRVASKDHNYPYPHSTRAWALALRLRSAFGGWMSESQLRSNMYVQIEESCNADGCQPVNHPGVVSYLYNHPAFLESDILVGGGAWARDGDNDLAWNGFGQLLTQSIPIVDCWAAMSKDHGVSDPGWVRATAIGIRRCPEGFDGCLDKVDRGESAGLIGTGYQHIEARFADVGDDNTYAMTAIGGFAFNPGNHPGRLLTDILPTINGATPNGGVVVWSKDHEYEDRGGPDSLSSYMIGLRKAP